MGKNSKNNIEHSENVYIGDNNTFVMNAKELSKMDKVAKSLTKELTARMDLTHPIDVEKKLSLLNKYAPIFNELCKMYTLEIEEVIKEAGEVAVISSVRLAYLENRLQHSGDELIDSIKNTLIIRSQLGLGYDMQFIYIIWYALIGCQILKDEIGV